jgi:hypothetical protein
MTHRTEAKRLRRLLRSAGAGAGSAPPERSAGARVRNRHPGASRKGSELRALAKNNLFLLRGRGRRIKRDAESREERERGGCKAKGKKEEGRRRLVA